MRIEIKSEDRIGMSQEILTALTGLSLNIQALEVSSQLMFVHLAQTAVPFECIKQVLIQVPGVKLCKTIELLPSERRERHLRALVNRLPDAIIDIDINARVMAFNRASEQLLSKHINYKGLGSMEAGKFKGLKITKLLDIDISLPLLDKLSSQNVEIAGQSYIAEISPISEQENSLGAVISLKSVTSLGRQISILQTRDEQEIDNIIGQSASIQLLKAQITRFAELELPVLIQGETGTGKELIARALHSASSRKQAPFLALNCAALPEHLLESELFGYANGAFTGAKKGGKPGLLELAEGGTLFLDEVAEMSPYLQAKLLRFLQDFKFRRLGSTKELQANVRVVSATHQNLLAMISKEKFREDLFYRLNVLNLSSPPLRDRVEDIVLIAQHFVAIAATKMNLPEPAIDENAFQLLSSYQWPGNIRELQSVLFRGVALNDKSHISAHDIQLALAQFNQENQSLDEPLVLNNEVQDWASAQVKFEKQLLSSLYPYYPTTRKLAERLKVSHNKIAMKLRQLDIKR
ncbi:TyrR family helix-turn-helix domain-containing protein [Colwellia chukchiensis]|uniref:HTH-type transcriptional regulatory protein TyrR n=1 Tax=Colwellia chukchiensis TaxID=641665 RepID=A0A1H7S6F7_9GAMM|nr:sigma 54-interacting transcriptional regulator [Colwellia chukchiensis]SEL68220.1 TyrR family helix-turn-helix domain-containing protein [Colwellia chukchiensis]